MSVSQIDRHIPAVPSKEIKRVRFAETSNEEPNDRFRESSGEEETTFEDLEEYSQESRLR